MGLPEADMYLLFWEKYDPGTPKKSSLDRYLTLMGTHGKPA